jgi:hypothetical protein
MAYSQKRLCYYLVTGNFSRRDLSKRYRHSGDLDSVTLIRGTANIWFSLIQQDMGKRSDGISARTFHFTCKPIIFSRLL